MEAAQAALAPFIRPRDEVLHIRRVLGANLAACLDNSHLGGKNRNPPVPLALADPPRTAPIKPDVRGLQREYLEALNANIKARQDQKELLETHHRCVSAPPPPTRTSADQAAAGFLADHIVALRLRKKEARLKAISKSLELLDQSPAASADFLEPSQVFRHSPPLPKVPREAVSSFVVDKALSKTSLDELLDRLQKSVLRAKLLLRKEEQQLSVVKKRASRPPAGNVPDIVKLAALTAARNELINWIEVELANASGDGPGGRGERQHTPVEQVAETRSRVEDQLSIIKHKYDEYLAARKSLLRAASQNRQPMIEPRKAEINPPTSSQVLAQPTASLYLLSPYLGRLLSVAQEQKGLILQKSHLNATVAKKTKDTCLLLDYLAEESQLLPKHHIPGRAPRQAGLLGDGIGSCEDYTVSSRSGRWVMAAEAAKLATLETVAERTEEGEVALEASARHLNEIGRLLGQQAATQGGKSEPGGDFWPSQDQKAGRAADIWSILDGSLGFLRSDGDDSY